METFTSKQIQKLAGVSHMQVSRWTELGIIEPFEDARGRGRVRRFSKENLVEAMICKQLASLHMETSVIWEVLNWLRAKLYPDEKPQFSALQALMLHPGKEPAYALLWWEGGSSKPYGRTLVAAKDIGKEILGWGAQLGIVLNLTSIIQEAEALASK